MGTWRNRINLLNTEEKSSFDAERQVMDFLFCFSQVDEKSEDWEGLIAKADEFMRRDGEVKRGNAEKIEKVLNDWATGKNSPLKDCDKPDVLRYSAQSYLFRGYNAMKKYFLSVGFDLEENLPKLKQETKECAKKVDSASAQPADIPSTDEENKNLRDYIQAEFGKAFYYGVERRTGQKMKPVDPYLNEIGPARDVLDRQADLTRNKIGATIDSIKDSKKWYGKDDESYTSMMQAVSAYMDTHKKEAEINGISANEREKLEKAMLECDRYIEKHDGIKFTSVGAKRLDAAKKMLEEMKKLPEARNASRKLVLDKAEEKAKKTTEEKRSKMAAQEREKASGPESRKEERVPMTFQNLKNAEKKENPKPNRVPQTVTKEPEKKVQKTKNSRLL